MILVFGAAALTLGLPALISLAPTRGNFLALAASVALVLGNVGIGGYAFVLVFFRALLVTDTLQPDGLDAVVDESGLVAFLLAWVVAFSLGELLLAAALWRAGTVRRWIPALLVAHVAVTLLDRTLPDAVGRYGIVLFALAVAAAGIEAAQPSRRPAH